MAVATTAAIAAGIGVAGGIAKAASGRKMMRDAKRAARNYRRQELKNVNRNRRVSTLGAELAREEAARGTATSVEALRSGGVRGVVGGLGAVQAANNQQSRAIGAGLDEQRVQLDREIAADDARIRAMQEQREQQDLAAIQSQVNAGQQTMYSGIGDIAQAGFGAATLGAMGGGAGAAGTVARDPRDLMPIEAPTFGLAPVGGIGLPQPTPNFGLYSGFGTLPPVLTNRGSNG